MKLDFCVLCGEKNDLHHHHLKPRSEGGSDDPTNLITLCVKHHGEFHDCMFKPNANLVSKSLRKLKSEGQRLGPKIKVPSLKCLLENDNVISPFIMPALVYFSYGYPVSDIVNIKWKHVSELPLPEEHKDYLIKLKLFSSKDEDYIYKKSYKPSEQNTVNSFSAFINRNIKTLSNVELIDPLISTEELIVMYNILPQTDLESDYVKPLKKVKTEKLTKTVKIEKRFKDLEYYQPTYAIAETKIYDNFIFASYIDAVKFSDWLFVNEKISDNILMVLYLSSLRIKSKTLVTLTWKDVLNSHAPEALKLEAKRIMKNLKLEESNYIYNKTESAVNVTIKRMRDEHYPNAVINKRGKTILGI